MSAPASARAVAMPRPMPRPAPVTTATCPVRANILLASAIASSPTPISDLADPLRTHAAPAPRPRRVRAAAGRRLRLPVRRAQDRAGKTANPAESVAAKPDPETQPRRSSAGPPALLRGLGLAAAGAD